MLKKKTKKIIKDDDDDVVIKIEDVRDCRLPLIELLPHFELS